MSKYQLPKKKIEYILSEESATEQLIELLDYYDIDLDKIGESDEKVATALERACDQLCDAIRTGQLSITRDENSSILVKQQVEGSKDPLIYKEMNAQAKLAMDKFKEEELYRRIYALMGSLSGEGDAVIKKLKLKDLAIAEALAAVFVNA